MPFANWDQALETEIEEIDIQHKHLIALLNKLYDYSQSIDGQKDLDGLFKDLISYTKNHFRTEEYYFKQTDYPLAKAHIDEHKFLTRTVLNKYEKFKKGQADMDRDLLDFLKSWWVHHIKKMDMQYKEFLKSHNIT